MTSHHQDEQPPTALPAAMRPRMPRYEDLCGERLFDPLADRDRDVERHVAAARQWAVDHVGELARLPRFDPARSAPVADEQPDVDVGEPVEVAPGVYRGADGWCEDRTVADVLSDLGGGR